MTGQPDEELSGHRAADRDQRCQHCGRRPDPDTPTAGNGLPWTWSISADHQHRRTVLCDHCVRNNARNIEARLDEEDWW